ncbi:MAG: hypothetical protein U0M15_04465 [Bacillota bacterium]|nr:hypothetical protein [Bacillota bacterium]
MWGIILSKWGFAFFVGSMVISLVVVIYSKIKYGKFFENFLFALPLLGAAIFDFIVFCEPLRVYWADGEPEHIGLLAVGYYFYAFLCHLLFFICMILQWFLFRGKAKKQKQ